MRGFKRYGVLKKEAPIISLRKIEARVLIFLLIISGMIFIPTDMSVGLDIHLILLSLELEYTKTVSSIMHQILASENEDYIDMLAKIAFVDNIVSHPLPPGLLVMILFLLAIFSILHLIRMIRLKINDFVEKNCNS